MIHDNPLRSYQKIAAQTASPGQLVLMLFDGVLKFLDRAMGGFQYDDPLEFNQTINNNVIRAQEILRHLNDSLDVEKGGELAMTLRRLYTYLNQRLQQSNAGKTPDGIQETIERITILRDAWSEMLRRRGGALPGPEEPALASAIS